MADNDSRAGTRYADQDIIDYVERIHAKDDPGLARAFAAPGDQDMPAIQVGRSEGRLLEMLLRLVAAKRVVEVGTLAGYSAIRMAHALGEGGHIWTVEVSEHHAKVARENIEFAGLSSRIDVVVGAGKDVLSTLDTHGPFDAVFIDADKESYDLYGAWAERNLRPGGLLLGDNAYLFGHLLEDTKAGAAMRRFHEQAAAAFDSVCIPTPDGLLLGIKR